MSAAFHATKKSQQSQGYNSNTSSRAKAHDQSRRKVAADERKQDPEKVEAIVTLQGRIIFLNSFTIVLTVIFLQVMMFLFNAVPMTNGILMSAGASVTYFVMSGVTLIFLYECHEAAAYMWALHV